MKNFVTALWVLMVAAVSAIIMLIPFVPGVSVMIADFTGFMADNLPFAAIAALILGLSLWLFFAQFRSNKPQMPSSVVLQAEGGEVRIALAAIDTLVRQAANQLKGVREVKTSFFRRNEGLGVHIRTTVSSEESIPDLTLQLQQKVTEHVHNVAGVKIEEIKVLVENVAVGMRNRVELR
ncbi:MAG: alkaline shock response membrane anchor protein AmaP [Eubacteriales bacterium]|nr:alkaline shock response membrane anchor protein AmaP [Eubacteriales bacterium]